MTEKSLFQESVIIARRLPNQTRIVASYYKPNLFDSRDQIPNHTGQRGHNSQSFVHLLKKKEWTQKRAPGGRCSTTTGNSSEFETVLCLTHSMMA